MGIKLAVLASGRGSNFASIQQAIFDGSLDAEIVVLISDKPNAPALELAAKHKIPTATFPYDKHHREAFEQKAAARIDEERADLVILAGFMRLITPWMIQHFAGRMLNIHPSLLPAFKGLHAQRQALEYGVKIAGCTVHLVTEEMDSGPILGQRAVPVLDDDTEDTLSNRILEQEHQLFPEVIATHGKRLVNTPNPVSQRTE